MKRTAETLSTIAAALTTRMIVDKLTIFAHYCLLRRQELVEYLPLELVGIICQTILALGSYCQICAETFQQRKFMPHVGCADTTYETARYLICVGCSHPCSRCRHTACSDLRRNEFCDCGNSCFCALCMPPHKQCYYCEKRFLACDDCEAEALVAPTEENDPEFEETTLVWACRTCRWTRRDFPACFPTLDD